MSIIRGVANSQDNKQNCVLMQQSMNVVGGGRMTAYVLYIDGKPASHTVSMDLGLTWFDYHAQAVANPVKVGTVAMHNVGGLSVIETLK